MGISVIVPIYNGQEYIESCIQTILNQTYKNLQIILVNDGSTDKSLEILKKIERNDSRVIVIDKKNGGVSSARNVGLRVVNQEYLSFVDCDDELVPDMYEYMFNIMEEYNADLVQCGYEHYVRNEIRKVHGTQKIYSKNRQETIKNFLEGKMIGGALWNKLINVDLAKDIMFNENLKNNEDILFIYQILLRARNVVYADELKYKYIYRNTSVCFNLPKLKQFDDACVVCKYMYEHSKGEYYNESARNRYLRALVSYYRLYIKYSSGKENEVIKEIKERILQISKSNYIKENGLKMSIYMIKYCPNFYRLFCYFYYYLKKPKWESSI